MQTHFAGFTDLAIRPDLPAAYAQAWSIISRSGNGWTAAERISMVQASRDAWSCSFCVQRKMALSPNAVSGGHTAVEGLPDPAIDAVHRIVTDPNRLTRAYVQELAEDGLSNEQYVELLGVVVAALSIDEFHRALSIPLEPLPQPADTNAPDGYRPPGAKANGFWVDSVEPADLSPAEADLYGGAPNMANVIKAMSLVPDSVRLLSLLGGAQYLAPSEVANPESNGGRALDRMQIEFIAGRVSSHNECFY